MFHTKVKYPFSAVFGHFRPILTFRLGGAPENGNAVQANIQVSLVY